MGRKKKMLNDEQIKQVEKLAGLLTVEQLADYFGMSHNTFRSRMREDDRIAEAYKRSRAKVVAGVAGNLVQQALAGDKTAQIFYLKTQAGWRETNRTEVSGPDGGPIETKTLTAEERQREIERLVSLAQKRASD